MDRRRLLTFVPLAIAVACGNPAGPSGPGSSGTVVVDGQTFNGTANGSGAGSRAPSGLNWIDLTISSCSSAPGIGITLKDVPTPPLPGRYAVNATSDVLSANTTIAGERWTANNTQMGAYCGDGFGGGVLPACTDESPGSGSLTIAGTTTDRVSGSYRFVMVMPSTYQGPLNQRPAPATKVVEGTFDLQFDANRVLCD